MTVIEKIKANESRIAVLRSRNNGLNGNIIKKIERQNRVLRAQL